MNKATIILLSLILSSIVTLRAFAVDYVIVKNLNTVFKPTSPRQANSSCFFYPNNDFKCACRFSNNTIWVSKEITQIQGLSTKQQYGYIRNCAK